MSVKKQKIEDVENFPEGLFPTSQVVKSKLLKFSQNKSYFFYTKLSIKNDLNRL